MAEANSPELVSILGSTGSIGTQALDVIARNSQSFQVFGLAASGSRPELLARQIIDFRPKVVAIESTTVISKVRDYLPAGFAEPDFLLGDSAATDLASEPVATVLNGITGSIGLAPTLATLAAGSKLALANKESLVAGGKLVKEAVQYHGQIIPVDSEHSAMAQAWRSGKDTEVAKLILTASGGPFRGRSRAELLDVTPEQALAHPTWKMGPVVTINSASLMNKALELIEAHLLFDVAAEKIEVVVHPQSIVHSMVEFHDGSTIAQASPPDMRLPIALGLSWPERLANITPAIDWSRASSWEFLPLDNEAFPALDLARQSIASSPLHPAVFNAANEVAVEAFLAGRCSFLEIVDTVAEVLSAFVQEEELSLASVLAAEHWARRTAAARLAVN